MPAGRIAETTGIFPFATNFDGGRRELLVSQPLAQRQEGALSPSLFSSTSAATAGPKW
jgi:hypothetical protein